MEWHQHVYEDERRRRGSSSGSWRWALIVVVVWLLLKLLRPLIHDVLGPWGAAGLFFAITGLCLYLAVREQRRKRRAWEARRGLR